MRRYIALLLAAGALRAPSARAEETIPVTTESAVFPMHWGLNVGGNFNWFIVGVPSGAVPIFGQLQIGPLLTIGNKLNLDLGFGLGIGGVTQNPSTVQQPLTIVYFTPLFFYFNGGVMYGETAPGHLRGGFQVITEFSLSTTTLFSESRLIVGPSFEFNLLAGFRARITAGYACDWYATNGVQQGLATLLALEFIP